MKKNPIKIYILLLLSVSVFFTIGCHTFRYGKEYTANQSFILRDRKSNPIFLVYKPGPKAPAYSIQLPNGYTETYIVRGNSFGYRFLDNQSVFFVSDEFCGLCGENRRLCGLCDTTNNVLLRLYARIKQKDTVVVQTKSLIEHEGAEEGRHWRYVMVYDLSKSSTTTWGFECLNISYFNVSEQDTCLLNNCINSCALIDSAAYRWYYRHRKMKTNKWLFINNSLSNPKNPYLRRRNQQLAISF